MNIIKRYGGVSCRASAPAQYHFTGCKHRFLSLSGTTYAVIDIDNAIRILSNRIISRTKTRKATRYFRAFLMWLQNELITKLDQGAHPWSVYMYTGWFWVGIVLHKVSNVTNYNITLIRMRKLTIQMYSIFGSFIIDLQYMRTPTSCNVYGKPYDVWETLHWIFSLEDYSEKRFSKYILLKFHCWSCVFKVQFEL